MKWTPKKKKLRLSLSNYLYNIRKQKENKDTVIANVFTIQKKKKVFIFF